MSERVTAADLRLAAEWLREYDYEASDAARMNAVAEWLVAEASKRDEQSLARLVRKEAGRAVPLSAIRAALRKQQS